MAAKDKPGKPYLIELCIDCISDMARSLKDAGFLAPKARIDVEEEPKRTSPYYGPNWPFIRQQILERDGNTCRDEGHVAAGGSDPGDTLVVHHKKPLREFGGDYTSANLPDNLIALCTLCHGRWHAKLNQEARATQS